MRGPQECAGTITVARGQRVKVYSASSIDLETAIESMTREHHPELNGMDLEAAWAFYQQQPDEVDQIIHEDEEA